MSRHKDPEKTVDVPPTGSRNPDPITDAPGSHPVETGIGAAIAGAATAASIGSVVGPVGTAVGMALGAVAGGLAGKGVGELIDPTTEDNWLRDNFSSRPYVAKGETIETYKPAYHYGTESATRHAGKAYSDVESDLRAGWEKTKDSASLTWDKAKGAVQDAFDYGSAHRYGGEVHKKYEGKTFSSVEPDLKKGWEKTKHGTSVAWDRAKGAVQHAFDQGPIHHTVEEAHKKYEGKPFHEIETHVRKDWEGSKHAAARTWDDAKGALEDAYDRTFQLREERLKVSKKPVETGDVTIRKEVVTKNKTIEVPVEREEIVIERRPASGHVAPGGITGKAEEIHIPVRTEDVEVGKETVVTGEVGVGKRKVQETHQASGTVRKEELKVDKHGDVRVDEHGKPRKS